MVAFKDVALALSSGGPRGFAYIGAIEEIESRGYNITSVAGTSIGSLIGGIYAAGKLEEVKDWLFSLDAWKVFTLMDLSISKNHLVKGDRVIDALKEIVPDMAIEDMRIPFSAVATDLYTGEEVVFDKGPLFTAIRASISIPSLFRPVKYGSRTLIDGGIANCMPTNRVHRNGQDILIAFDVNDVDVEGIRKVIVEEEEAQKEKEAKDRALDEQTRSVIDSVKNDRSLTLAEKFKMATEQGHKVLTYKLKGETDKDGDQLELGDNYYTILSRTFSLMNHVNAKMGIERDKPEVVARMPFDAFGDIADYAKAREICEMGRILMKEALDNYEQTEIL
ncbi:MAG: patatin-like phospholipase family protein [Candidatus Cryptobacteroides sp.]